MRCQIQADEGQPGNFTTSDERAGANAEVGDRTEARVAVVDKLQKARRKT